MEKVKLVLFILLLLNSVTGIAQSKPADTSQLAGYSYLIMGRTRSGCTVQATGFLVRSKNKIYVVTACHVINGWYYESFEKDDSYPDTLYLRVYNKLSGKAAFIPMDIRMLKRQKSDPDSPDVYFYPIVIPDSYQINALETLINKTGQTTPLPNEILVYGFCLNEDSDSIDFEKLKVSKAHPWLHDKDDYTCDPFVYHVGYTGNELGPGDSGSPVYFIYKDQAANLSLQFGGLLIGGAPTQHLASIIRPEIIRNMLPK